MPADPMETDALRMVRALIRRGLHDRGELDALDRLGSGAWHLRLEDELYIASWPDGTTLATVPLEAVVAAVAILRARRDARHRALD